MGDKSYKIQHPDGRYSKGGSGPYWTKSGKVWANIGALKNHVNLVTDNWLRGQGLPDLTRHPYEGCTVVVLESVERERRPVDLFRRVDALIDEANERVDKQPWDAARYAKLASKLLRWRASR